MKKFFSSKLYIETMRQFRLPAWIMTGILCIITATTDFIVAINGGYGENALPSIMEFVPALWAFMYLAPVVLTFLAFDFLNSRSHSDFYHSLPNTRQSIFLSRMAAVMTMTFGGIVLSCLVSLFGRLLWQMPINMMSYFYIILFSSVTSLVMAGGVSLAISITGTRLSNIVAILLIVYFPRLILYIIASYMESVAPVLVTSSMGVFFSFRYNFAFAGIGFIEMGDKIMSFWPGILYSMVLGIAYCALGLLAFVRRRSETADKAAPSKKLHRIYAIALATPLALLASNIVASFGDSYYFDISLLTVLIVFDFIIYMVYEMITIKSFKKAFKAFPALLLLGVISIGVSFGSKGLALATMNNIPDREDIKGVYVTGSSDIFGGLYSSEPTYNELLQDNLLLKNDKLIDLTYQVLKRDVKSINDGAYNGYPQIVVKFLLNNGKTITRQIDVSAQIDQYHNALLGDEDYKKAAAAFPSSNQIKDASFYGLESKDVKKILLPVFLEEMGQMTEVERVEYYNNYYSSDTLGTLWVNGYLGLEAFSNYYYINLNVPKTSQKIVDILYDNNLGTIQDLLPKLNEDSYENYGIQITWYQIENNNIMYLDGIYYSNEKYTYEEEYGVYDSNSKTYAPEAIESMGYAVNLIKNIDLQKAQLTEGTMFVKVSISGYNYKTSVYDEFEIYVECTEELNQLYLDLEELWAERYNY